MKNLLSTIFFCLSVLSGFAQTDDSGWTLEREADGIQVFSRPQQGPSQVNEAKGVLRISGNIDSAFKVLSDWPTFSKTDPIVIQTEILNRINPNEYYIWDQVRMPMFVSDRDIVSKVTLSRTSKGSYMIATKAYPTYIPEKPKMVRIQEIEIVIYLQPLDNTSFELQFKVKIGDPQSGLALSASNKGVIESTFERMKRVRDLVATRPIAGQ